MIRLLRRGFTARSVTLVVCETALIVAAVAAGAYLRLGDGAWEVVEFENGFAKALLIAFTVQVCLFYAGLYELRSLADRGAIFTRSLHALAAASLLLAAVYYWFPEFVIGRGVFLIAAALVIVLVVGWRIVFYWASRRLGPRERILLVGRTPATVSLAAEIESRRHELGVEVVGFIDPDPTHTGQPLTGPGVIGTVDEIPAIVRARNVDCVVVSLGDARGKLPMEKLLDLRFGGVNFVHLASMYEEYTGKIALENLRPSWLIFSDGFRKTPALTTAKRVMDVAASAVGLIVALPLLLVVALAVRLTSRGPVLYHQQRVGQHGKVFTVHKFRSMREDAEVATGPIWASKAGDSRVTSIGPFLRRTRLDELPQLWNILRGEMSLVGPRPERPEFVGQLAQEIPFYRQRHIVRPGLTGWAQVRYTYGASKEDAMEKLQYDLYYIKNLSMAFDLFILLSTIRTVVARRGA